MNNSIDEKLRLWCQDQLDTQGLGKLLDFQVLSGDASSRRYFRLTCAQATYIAVIGKDQYQQFIDVAEWLMTNKLPIPQILASDQKHGYLLQSDLGDEQLYDVINDGNVNGFYRRALDLLIAFQQLPTEQFKQLPNHDADAIQDGLARFPQWFMRELLQTPLSHTEQTLWRRTEIQLLEACTQQPQKAMHFDYQSRNLMCRGDALSLIDFQDACTGPVFYDVVSLLRDSYLDWPAERIDQWRDYYAAQAIAAGILNADAPVARWFDLSSTLRHLRVLGTFARLAIRDNKPDYLDHIEQTLRHLLLATSRQSCLLDLNHWLRQHLIPLCQQQGLYPANTSANNEQD